MPLKLVTYTGTQPGANFYIQNKGLHSGRPLKNPIRNCFAVYTDDELLFEKVYSLYIGRYFEPIICGSVVPFIRLDETVQVIKESKILNSPCCKELHTIRKIDDLLCNLKQQMKSYKELQVALCRKINKF